MPKTKKKNPVKKSEKAKKGMAKVLSQEELDNYPKSGLKEYIGALFGKGMQKKGAAGGPIPPKGTKTAPKGTKTGPGRKGKPGVPHDVDDGTYYLKDGGSASKFPDLSGDGKVTQKDILMGRGVITRKRGGSASKNKKTKIEAYRKLGKQKYDKGMTPDIGEKGRKSFKKTRVKKKDLVDIAGVIKSTGDPYLGKLGNLKTRFKDKKTAKAAGVQFRAKGGLAGRLAKRGYGKARK